MNYKFGRDKTRVSVPKIPSQRPGLVIIRTVCPNDASVVAIDMEKIGNRRKRNAGT